MRVTFDLYDFATITDTRTQLNANGGEGLRASWARRRFYEPVAAPMFYRMHAVGRGWRIGCTLCDWSGVPHAAGFHAREAHGERLFDLNTYGMLDRYRVRSAAARTEGARDHA